MTDEAGRHDPAAELPAAAAARPERWNRWVAIAIVAVYLATVTAHALLEPLAAASARGLTETVSGTVEQVVLLTGFGVVAMLGALLVARRPRHPMGWIFATVGLLLGVGASGNTFAAWYLASGRSPGVAVALLAWPNNWYWYLLLSLMFTYIPLLFPDGHLPSRRWWWQLPAWTAGLATAAMCALGAVAERIELQDVDATLPNPLGIAGMPGVEQHPLFGPFTSGLLVGVVTAVAAVVVRFRRSRGPERQQLKWFLFAAALLPTVVLTEVLPLPELVGSLLFAAVILTLPVAIALAILRYRLYDIDRIIRRTATYAVVVALLVGVYGGTVILGRAALRPVLGDSDLAVALSTLIVAALFRPLLTRVRALVDRRFDRRRYDAQRTIDRFGSRLRDEIELTALRTELTALVSRTLRPVHVSLWTPETRTTASETA